MERPEAKWRDNMNITENEKAVLSAIDHNEYGDVLSDPIWTDSVFDNLCTDIPSTSFPGVVSSLVKKGLIYADAVNRNGEEKTMGMTPEGIEVYVNLPGVQVSKVAE